jgi:hypothetical protein
MAGAEWSPPLIDFIIFTILTLIFSPAEISDRKLLTGSDRIPETCTFCQGMTYPSRNPMVRISSIAPGSGYPPGIFTIHPC